MPITRAYRVAHPGHTRRPYVFQGCHCRPALQRGEHAGVVPACEGRCQREEDIVRRFILGERQERCQRARIAGVPEQVHGEFSLRDIRSLYNGMNAVIAFSAKIGSRLIRLSNPGSSR